MGRAGTAVQPARRLIVARQERDRATGLRRYPLRSIHRLPTGTRLYLGQGSVTDGDRHVKYVDRREPLYPYTWGELGREWVREQYRRLGVPTTRRRPVLGIARNADIPPALYFQPGPTPGDWAYVDIRACYGVLLGRWPLQTRYVHALALKAGRHLYRPVGRALDVCELVACKPLRLAVWGTIRGGTLQWRTRKGKWASTAHADRLTQPGLAGLVLTAVHEIAWRAVHDFGARMWLTDAAILPMASTASFRRYIAREWGLAGEVDARGDCHLTGLGAYRVGGKQSDIYPRRTRGADRLLRPLPWQAV